MHSNECNVGHDLKKKVADARHRLTSQTKGQPAAYSCNAQTRPECLALCGGRRLLSSTELESVHVICCHVASSHNSPPRETLSEQIESSDAHSMHCASGRQGSLCAWIKNQALHLLPCLLLLPHNANTAHWRTLMCPLICVTDVVLPRSWPCRFCNRDQKCKNADGTRLAAIGEACFWLCKPYCVLDNSFAKAPSLATRLAICIRGHGKHKL